MQKLCRVQVLLEPAQLATLKAIGARTHTALSQLLRDAVDGFLAERGDPAVKQRRLDALRLLDQVRRLVAATHGTLPLSFLASGAGSPEPPSGAAEGGEK